MKTIPMLRSAIQHALDELRRVNAAHACVRPDVTYTLMEALRNSASDAIPHATENEKLIVGKLVSEMLNRGYTLSVWDGEEMTVVESIDAAEIFSAMSSTESDKLYVHRPDGSRAWVMLIWGNDVDVISDYQVSLEADMADANRMAESLS